MKNISIDQSFSNFAYVVFGEDGKPESSGVLHTGARVPGNLDKQYGKYFDTVQEQLVYLESEFSKIIADNQPCRLIFEGLAFGAKGDRVFSLGGLFYHVTTTLITKGLVKLEDVVTVPPTSVKKVARDRLIGDEQFEKDKDGNVVYLKSKKPKLKKMDKNDMLKALCNTEDKWIVEGFSSSSKKVPTGLKDIPDAYFIGKAFLEKKLD